MTWMTCLLGALLGSAHAQSSFSGDSLSIEAPDYYVVQPGDTLWEISSTFLGNPYYWPRLWSINDYITNPHWIYPGNRIVFRMGTLVEPPQIDLDGGGSQSRDGYVSSTPIYDTAEAECGPNVRFDQPRPSRSYLAPGFLAHRGDIDIFGNVHKARPMQTYMGEGDILYLNLDDPDAYECGDVLTVFRRVRKQVRHPDRRRTKLGSLYRIVGEVKVVHLYEDTVTAVVRQAWSEISRGDLIGPQIPVSIEVEVGVPSGDMDSVIVGRFNNESVLMADGETIFIDRGRADGVRVGNAFWIYDQRDEYSDHKKEDDDLPPSVIGRVVVVRVDEYTSTAIVTDADRSLWVGARLTQKVE